MVELRPFTKSDIGQLINRVDSEEFLVQWAGSGLSHPLHEEQLGNLVLSTDGVEPRPIAFTVVDAEGGAIGHIQLSNIDRENRSAGVARVLVGPKSLRGKGLGTEIMRAVLKVGFEKLGLHRIYLHVYDFNQAAIRCYEKVGFRQEGLLRDATRVGDSYWSAYVMSNEVNTPVRKRNRMLGEVVGRSTGQHGPPIKLCIGWTNPDVKRSTVPGRRFAATTQPGRPGGTDALRVRCPLEIVGR